MVWYYCEFCNRNVQIKEGAINKCPDCGHFLHELTVTTEERHRRERERVTYCDNCRMMVFAIPVELAMRAVKEETTHNITLIKNPPKAPHYVKDNRYKLGYRRTKEGEITEIKTCCYCILFFVFIGVAIFTYGIGLVGLIPLYYFYRKKAKQKQAVMDNVAQMGQDTIKTLSETSSKYQYVCKRCFSGLELRGAAQTKLEGEIPIISNPSLPKRRYCELCGYDNYANQEFCENCGSLLKS